MKKYVIAIITVVGVLLLSLLLYIGYFTVFSAMAQGPTEEENTGNSEAPEFTGESITVTLWNIGGGVSTPDYSDYTEGGEDTRGKSKKNTEDNLKDIFASLKPSEKSIILLQEADVGATRSFGLDEVSMIVEGFPKNEVYASRLYDSPYLIFPFEEPVGITKNSLVSVSPYKTLSCERIPLPVFGLNRIERYLDADRAFTVTTLSLGKENGDKKLAVYNVSLTDAEAGDGEIAKSQLKALTEDMTERSKEGTLIICAGDFSLAYEKGFLSEELLPEGFSLVFPEGITKRGLHEGDGGAVTDGFIISGGFSEISLELSNTDFALSDHAVLSLSVKIEE